MLPFRFDNMEKEFFINNRRNVLNKMNDDSLMFIYAGFHQDEGIFKDTYDESRNYFYTTGLFEYGNTLVLGRIGGKLIERIYIKRLDIELAKWVGEPLTKEEVNKISGILDIRYQDQFKKEIKDLIEESKYLYFDIGGEDMTPSRKEFINTSLKYKREFPDKEILDASKIFMELRTVKNEMELEYIKRAIDITKIGVENILKNIGPLYEYQLESYFDQAIKYNGATGYSFPTIAASGINSTCLHYMENNRKAKDGDLILFDLGASYNMYCADISRTFPINGKFSPRQRQIYDIVLRGQEAVLNYARPGLTTKDLNNHLIQFYQRELKRIGKIKKDDEVFKYYYHGVSHHIGLDCHDLCLYDGLRPNSLISNEPGLYIKEEEIGIRIEDDMLITKNGAILLSKDIIKDPDEIEKFIKENKKC